MVVCALASVPAEVVNAKPPITNAATGAVNNLLRVSFILLNLV